LPDDFSERSKWSGEPPREISRGQRPRADSSSGIDRPFGAKAAWQITGWKKRDLREVSAYSTVYPEFALGAD